MSQSAGGSSPTWLFGPWSRWIRDPADLLRLSFLIGGAVSLALGNGSDAVRLWLTCVVCLIPRLIGTALTFDVAFGAAMSLQAWGNVSRVFWSWPFYHYIVHFTLTMATAMLVYFVLVFLRLVPDLAHETGLAQKVGIGVLAFAIGSTVNAIYEEYEWFAVNLLGAHLLENYRHDVHDLFFGGLGSVTAALWLGLWSTRRWVTHRPVQDDPLARGRAWLERRMERGVREPRGPLSQRRHKRERLSVPVHPIGRRIIERVVFGDWSRPVRDVSDLARISLLVGLAISAGAGEWDRVARFGLSLLVSLATRKMDAPRPVEMAFNAALLIEAWGDFSGASRTFTWFDDGTDLVLSLGATPVLYLVLVRVGVFPEFADEPRVHRRIALFIAAMCLGFCAGIYYEQYVWLANHYLGEDIFTNWGGLTRRLGLDWLGAAAGAALLVAWDAYGWGTRRRIRVARQPPRRELQVPDALPALPASAPDRR